MERDAFARLCQGFEAAGATGVRVAWTNDTFSFLGASYEELAQKCPRFQMHMAADQEGYYYLNSLQFGPMGKKPTTWNAIATLVRYKGGGSESFLNGKWEKLPPSTSKAEQMSIASTVPQILAGGMTIEENRAIFAEYMQEFVKEMRDKTNDLDTMLQNLADIVMKEDDISGYTFGTYPDVSVYLGCPFYMLPGKKSLCTIFEVRTRDLRNGFGAAMECDEYVIDAQNTATLRNIYLFQKKGKAFRVLYTTSPDPSKDKKRFSWV
ncbi:MAG: hypothetical protein IIZ39_08265 [Blautia sp.]|nr:hypothetical protein [Blautia sp.]